MVHYPQRLAVGIQWRVFGGRPVARQGVLRRPPPRPRPRRRAVPGLRLHAAAESSAKAPYEQHAGESAAIVGDSEEAISRAMRLRSPNRCPRPLPNRTIPVIITRKRNPMPLPPQPEPETTTAVPRAKARNASHNSATASGDGRAAKSKPTGRKTFDVGSLQLNELDDNPIKQTSAAKPKSNGWKSADDDDVQAADYREPPARSTGASIDGRQGSDEEFAHPMDRRQPKHDP